MTVNNLPSPTGGIPPNPKKPTPGKKEEASSIPAATDAKEDITAASAANTNTKGRVAVAGGLTLSAAIALGLFNPLTETPSPAPQKGKAKTTQSPDKKKPNPPKKIEAERIPSDNSPKVQDWINKHFAKIVEGRPQRTTVPVSLAGEKISAQVFMEAPNDPNTKNPTFYIDFTQGGQDYSYEGNFQPSFVSAPYRVFLKEYTNKTDDKDSNKAAIKYDFNITSGNSSPEAMEKLQLIFNAAFKQAHQADLKKNR